MSERRRYTYAESRMKPPFWIVMDRRRRMAEAWDENDAALLVAALNHFAARPADRAERAEGERDALLTLVNDCPVCRDLWRLEGPRALTTPTASIRRRR